MRLTICSVLWYMVLLGVTVNVCGQAVSDALHIDRPDVKTAVSVSKSLEPFRITGSVTTSKARWLYVISRVERGAWYLHAPGIRVKTQGGQIGYWHIDGITLNRHGGVGTPVEMKCIGTNTQLPPGYLRGATLKDSHNLVSESVFIRIGHNRAPRLRILSIWKQSVRTGRVLAGIREANVKAQLQDIPSGTYVYPVVQPVNDEKRWVSRVVPYPPYGSSWESTVYLGRRDPKIKDNYHYFWVYLIVIRRPILNDENGRSRRPNDEEEGIGLRDWEEKYHPYIIARSDVVTVLRTGVEHEAQIVIETIGSKEVKEGGKGTSGYAALPVDDIGECSGRVFLPSTSPYEITRLRVWILMKNKNARLDENWRVIAGPIKLPQEGVWRISPLSLPTGNNLMCMAVLTKANAPGFKKGHTVTDEAISSAITSDYMLVTPEKH